MVPPSVPQKSAPGRVLKNTKSFASDAVTDVGPHLSYPSSELLLATTNLAHWAAHAGISLERELVFSEETINAFVRDGMTGRSDASRGNVRAQLRRMREVFTETRAVPERLTASKPVEPYTDKDIRRFSDWAKRQKTPDFRRDARTILGAGLGAGLSAGEIGELRGGDVLHDEAGVQLVVRGARQRVVQVLRSQEDRLLTATQEIKPSQYLVRPGRETNPTNLITNIVDRGLASELGPNSQRMRATWLVQHLNAGTPIGVLKEAAGLADLKALTRYLPFANPVPGVTARRALRGAQ